MPEAVTADPMHARGRRALNELVTLFFDPYPAFRPNYAECQLLFACLYSIAVKHDIGPGQWKTLDLLRKKHAVKGIVLKPREP